MKQIREFPEIIKYLHCESLKRNIHNTYEYVEDLIRKGRLSRFVNQDKGKPKEKRSGEGIS